jgi:hypothetical protein
MPGSPIFDRARATGLRIADWHDVILVNMLGKRFYDETGGQYIANNYNSLDPYVQGSYLNAKNVNWNPNNFLNAALAGIDDGHNGGGPIWAIFDSDAVIREGWTPTPPYVDIATGLFFSANRLADLAEKIVMKYQRVPMPPAKPGGDRRALQFLCRFRRRRGIRQTQANVQDHQAALLCRLGPHRLCTTPAPGCASMPDARSSA